MRVSSKVEMYRVIRGKYKSQRGDTFGLFYIPFKTVTLKVIVCDGSESGWDHVSVSLPNRCPNWVEMSHVKDLFFSDDETVVQFHPKRSEYVNNHPYCLHLWKKVGEEYELPPSTLTGLKDLDISRYTNDELEVIRDLITEKSEHGTHSGA